MMGDKPFRVLLDLTDLHIENFKYVWINVSPRELKTISDFKKSVLFKINLERDDVKFFVRDGLLLEQETIIVLREDDTVKVQYEDQLPHFQSHIENSEGKDKNSSRKRNHSESDISDIPAKHKRSRTEIGLTCEQNEGDFTETKKKKKKHKKSDSLSLDTEKNQSVIFDEDNSKTKGHKIKDKKLLTLNNAVDDNFSKHESFVSFEIVDTSPKQTKENESLISKSDNLINSSNYSSPREKKNTYQSEVNLIESFKVDIEDNKTEGLNNNCPKKKKRKRYKKRKPTFESTNIDNNDNESEVSKFVDKSVNRKHIVYSSPNKRNGKFDDVNQNCSTDTFVVNEENSITSEKSSSNFPKISTPAQSDGCNNPNWHVSLLQSKNFTDCKEVSTSKSVFATHENLITKNIASQISNKNEITPEENSMDFSTLEVPLTYQNRLSNKCDNGYENLNVKEVASFQSYEDNGNICRKYEDLPALNSLPKVGTHIAYKTLELDENYSPVITDYREGIVKSINSDKEEVEVEFYKELIKPGRTGKFENLLEDEIPPPEVKTSDVLKWSSVIQPKYIN